ncbi:DUF4916 domain-containing protein [Microbacterium sp. NPDC056569]|uniref:DUF4916 domain-containing protein n=1 Tax=Microbacterium sp. NPDC056569 TaxID=3345867 RepID=UPI00366C5C7E
MSFLPADLYAQIEQSVPLACVDFVPVQEDRVGLIRRASPFGQVWCHLGGRILRGETMAQALRRHAHDTLAVDLVLPDDPQPAYVYQWFPPEIMPQDGVAYGSDPRKQAVGLSFAVEITGTPVAQNEALDFGWFQPGALPAPLWPGSAELLRRLL